MAVKSCLMCEDEEEALEGIFCGALSGGRCIDTALGLRFEAAHFRPASQPDKELYQSK